MLGGDAEFAGEGEFGGAAAEGFFGGKPHEVGIIIFLGNVREDQKAGAGIESVGIGKKFADGMIGKMSGAGEHALLDDPRVRPDLEHVQIVIGFKDHAVGFAKMDFHKFGHVAEIGADRDLRAVGAEGEADGIGGIVRNGKSVNINIANGKALASLNGFDAAEAFAESFGEDALESVHGGFGDVQRSFPKAENLREAVAVVGVLVGDEHGVEAIEVALDRSEPSEGFTFTEAGVDEDAGALGFEQG